jgi:hypothetical protein
LEQFLPQQWRLSVSRRPTNYLVSISSFFFNQAIYRFNLKYHKMRKTIIILVIVATVATAFASCASSRGGCAMSQGYIGYGHSMGR